MFRDCLCPGMTLENCETICYRQDDLGGGNPRNFRLLRANGNPKKPHSPQLTSVFQDDRCRMPGAGSFSACQYHRDRKRLVRRRAISDTSRCFSGSSSSELLAVRNPGNIPTAVTTPIHGGREIGPPLFFKTLRQLGLSPVQFEKPRRAQTQETDLLE